MSAISFTFVLAQLTEDDFIQAVEELWTEVAIVSVLRLPEHLRWLWLVPPAFRSNSKPRPAAPLNHWEPMLEVKISKVFWSQLYGLLASVSDHLSKNLQQHIEDIGVCFSLCRIAITVMTAHCFGANRPPSLTARRRTNQFADGVTFHVFRHIQADSRLPFGNQLAGC